MARLIVKNTNLLITCGLKTAVLNIERENSFDILEIPERINVADVDDENKEMSTAEVVAADISDCGKLFVLGTSDKRLILWETDMWSVVSNRTSARVASRIRFVPSGKTIVLADKSGDAYSFSVVKPNEDGKLLLGHLSMLLDILVSQDEKYIITCDRDEKIRISRYPNAYNIESYCLGHKDFVTSLSLLPNDKTVLISSSGDGTIRFWDYKAGVELHVIHCNEDIFLNKDVPRDDGGCKLPIKLIASCFLDTTVSLICSSISKIHGCLVYRIISDLKHVTSELIQVVRLKAEPWDILLTLERELWILGPVDKEPLCVFMWDYNSCHFVNSNKLAVVAEVNNRWDLFQNIVPTTLFSLLYKRKYDNIQIYQERKKQRLAGALASSGTDVTAL